MTYVAKDKVDMLTYLQVLHPVFTWNPPALVPLDFFSDNFGVAIGTGQLVEYVWMSAAMIDCIVLLTHYKRHEMLELHDRQRISSSNYA